MVVYVQIHKNLQLVVSQFFAPQIDLTPDRSAKIETKILIKHTNKKKPTTVEGQR